MLKTIVDWQCDFGRPLTPVDAVQWFDAVVAAGWVFDNDRDTWEYVKEMHEKNGYVLDCIVTDRLVGSCFSRVLHGSSVALKAASQAGSNHPYAQAARREDDKETVKELQRLCRLSRVDENEAIKELHEFCRIQGMHLHIDTEGIDSIRRTLYNNKNPRQVAVKTSVDSYMSGEDDDLASEAKRMKEFVRRRGGKVARSGGEEFIAKEDMYAWLLSNGRGDLVKKLGPELKRQM